MNSRGASIFGRIHWSERGSSRTVTIRHAVLSPPANGATAMPAGIAAALRCILLRYDAAEYPDRRDADRSRQMLLGRETFGHAERLSGDRESLNPVQSIDLYSPVLLGRAIYIPPSFVELHKIGEQLYMLGFFQVKRMIFDLQHPVLAHGLENIGQVLQCRRYILDKNTIADTLVLMNHITGRETVQQPTGDIVLDQFCLIFDIVFVGRLVTSGVCRKTPRRLPYACGRPATGLACLRTCCCAANGG